MPRLSINGREVEAAAGATILEAADAVGIKIPTLCFLEGKPPLGACRVCLVEIEGAKALAASCSTPAIEGMRVVTASKRVRQARRTVVELLLSEHAGDCQSCVRSDDCELRSLAHDLGIQRVDRSGERLAERIDDSTAAIVRDSGKCIKCRRCLSACNLTQLVGALGAQFRGFHTVIGPAFGANLDKVPCVQCGQCAACCPVGAITEKSHVASVWTSLEDPSKHVVVQTAPAIRAALGECFGLPPGTLVTGKMVAALRELGFKGVFDTNFTADLTIIEEGTELLARLRAALAEGKPADLPQYSSCSPGWIRFAEHYYPEILPNISTCKSPQQMFGALAKTYYADKMGLRAEDVVVVSVMPCTAKKFEAGRPEMTSSGVVDVDYVLTTRELGAMIKEAGLDFLRLPDGTMDAPFGLSSGAADIFANSGGVMEAALRTVHELVTGREIPGQNLHLRAIEGLEGLKEASVTITGAVPAWNFLEGVTVKVAVAHSLSNAARLIDAVKEGRAAYHFVEIMTCPGGCISGGGQPRPTDDAVRLARMQAIFREDEGKRIRTSHENPAVQELYRDFLGEPLGQRSHELLHTHYTDKSKAGKQPGKIHEVEEARV